MVQELLESNQQLATLSDQVQEAYTTPESQRFTLERFLMQAPANFAILLGPHHRFELVNPHYQKLFPFRKLVGKTAAEAVPEVVEEGFIQILDRVYEAGTLFITDQIPVQADWNNSGKLEEAYFTTTYQPLREGDQVKGIIVFGYEITDKIKLRQHLKKLSEA